MPVYEYKCCVGVFEKLVPMKSRDKVCCWGCHNKAERQMSNFRIGNQTYVANNLKNIEFATGVRGIETMAAAQAALKATGTEPIDAYYRAPKPPPPKEVTMEELAPYLDGMPLNNEPVRE